MGSSSTSWTSESNTHAGTSKVYASSTWDAYVSTNGLKIQGAEGNSGILELFADEGDDNADKWKWQVADGGSMTWESYTGGSYAAKLTLGTGGDLTVAGDLTVTGADVTLGADADGTDRSVTFGHSTLKTIMGIDDSLDCFVINTDAAFDSTLENNSLSIDASHNVEIAGDFKIQGSKKMYFDGGGDTYIWGTSTADQFDIVVGGKVMLGMGQYADETSDFVQVPANTKFIIGGTGGESSDTYFLQEPDDNLYLHVGGAQMFLWDQDVSGGGNGTIEVGVDGDGCDFKLWGESSSHYCMWDQSRDDFVLTSDCNIGLGDTTPSYPLVIQTTGRTSIGKFISTDMSAQVFIQGGGVDDESQLILSCNDEGSSGSRGLIRYKHNATEASQLLQIQVGDGAAQEAINIFGNGYVGIGKEAPVYALDVIGTNVNHSGNKYVARFHHDGGTGGDNDNNGIIVQAGADDGDTSSNDVSYFAARDGNGSDVGSLTHNTSGNFVINATSDSRLKENIVDTQLDGLSLCNQIKVREFNWKDGFKGGIKNRAGFIAQEVKAVFPEAVSGTDGATKNKVTDAVYDKDRNIVEPQKIETVIDPMMVSQGSFIPILMKAIQQLSDKVTALENA